MVLSTTLLPNNLGFGNANASEEATTADADTVR
jgi:hypothetical protein